MKNVFCKNGCVATVTGAAAGRFGRLIFLIRFDPEG